MQETVARDLFERGCAKAAPFSAHDVPPMYERLLLSAPVLNSRSVRRRLDFTLEHDLFRKPASTFRDHALDVRNLAACVTSV
jgi:hypothetical protein